jgi:alpha-beta hydrolase superfamily lysophospholipase
MFKFIKRILGLIIFVALGLAGVMFFGPREKISAQVDFDPETLGVDLDAYLLTQEAVYPQITEGAEKQIIWAGEKDARTKDVIVYLHGFSATSQEIRPVPDRVAAALGANLYLPRLQGHGLPGVAMGIPNADDLVVDLAEAMAIARRLGDRVILMTTSTGGTLAAVGLNFPEIMNGVEGIIFMSPNFGVHNKLSFLGRLPFGRVWFSWLAGKERSWEPMNALQGKYWTTSYPPHSIIPMMSMIAHTENMDFSKIDIPAMFYFSDKDKVVNAEITREVIQEWGGEVHVVNPTLENVLTDGYHVIAGDIVSPSQTAPATAAMLDWIKALSIR